MRVAGVPRSEGRCAARSGRDPCRHLAPNLSSRDLTSAPFGCSELAAVDVAQTPYAINACLTTIAFNISHGVGRSGLWPHRDPTCCVEVWLRLVTQGEPQQIDRSGAYASTQMAATAAHPHHRRLSRIAVPWP